MNYSLRLKGPPQKRGLVAPSGYRPGVERIDLREVEHKVHRWWVTGEPGHHEHAVIGLGQLADGRWFAARAGTGWAGMWAARDERQARLVVESWIRRRGGHQAWWEIEPGNPWAPAVYETAESPAAVIVRILWSSGWSLWCT